MAEPFLISKALDLSKGALGKATSVVIKGLLVLGVVSLVVWSVYVTVVRPHTKPNPSTTQNAGEIQNYQYTITPKSYFGCSNYIIDRERNAKLTNKTAVK